MTICEPLVDVLPGTQVRPVSLADVPVLADLMRRVSTAAVGEPDASEDEVRDDLVGPRFDLSRDTALVLDGEGRALVYAQAYDEHDERAFIDVFVTPELSDTDFARVAGLAIDGAKTRLREALRERAAESTTVGAGLYRGEDRMLAAYTAAGLSRDRVYWRMTIDLTPELLPELLRADESAHVDIRAVDPDDDEVMRQALALRNETFREHHGHVDMEFDQYAEVWRTATKYDRETWWFAYVDGEPVGICLADNGKAEENAGYIRTLGVLESARGQGIAKALLIRSFVAYHLRGRTSVQLGVDASNESGAIRLYEGAGMRVILAIDSLTLRLSAELPDPVKIGES